MENLRFVRIQCIIFEHVQDQNRFQIKNRVKTRKRPGVFRKFSAIEILFLENFQNYRTELSQRLFDRGYKGTSFLLKVKTCPNHVILIHLEVCSLTNFTAGWDS